MKNILSNNNKFIIAVNSSDEDICSIIMSYHHSKNPDYKNLFLFNITNKASSPERTILRTKLLKNDFPDIDPNDSFFDYLIKSEQLYRKDKKYNYTIKNVDYKFVSLLIFLAIKEKIYFSEIKQFDFDKEIQQVVKDYPNLIQLEYTLNFEQSNEDLSQTKYVLNSQYWLRRILGEYAKKNENEPTIIDAYKHIVDIIFLMTKNNTKKRMRWLRSYIFYANINNIFVNKYKGDIKLHKAIYENLSSRLNTEPQFLHQYAKCLINYSEHYTLHNNTKEILENALKKCKIALSILENPGNNYQYMNNSIANIYYTIAIIHTLICKYYHYENIEYNFETIDALHIALNFPNFRFQSKDYNIDEKDNSIWEFIYHAKNKINNSKEYKEKLSQIQNIMYQEQTRISSLYKQKLNKSTVYTTKRRFNFNR